MKKSVLFLLLSLTLFTVYGLNLSKIYEQRLKLGKDMPVLANAAARHFFIKGNLEKSKAILQNNLKKHPEDVDSLFLTAAINNKQKKYTEAKDILHLLLKKNPRNISYLSLLILTLDEMGNKKLLAKYQDLFKRHSAGKKKKVKRAKNVTNVVKKVSGTSLIKRMQKNKIDKMKASKTLMYFSKSDLPEARQEKLAQELAEKAEVQLQDRGFRVRDFDSAYENLKNILVKAPKSSLAQLVHWKIHFFYLGLTDDGNEDWQELQVCLESYLAKYPDDEVHKKEAYDKLAMACEELGDWETMLYYSELYLQRAPKHYPMLLNKANALLELGEMERGVELMERIIQESPQSVQYFLAKDTLKELGY